MKKNKKKKIDKVIEQEKEFSGLSYKTRGGTAPFDKAKVYFCCYHKDLKKYLDMLSSDILEKENCCIWYKESKNALAESELYEKLKEMDLFVVPITKNLLSCKDDAVYKEIKIATDLKIPVLPILVENISIKLFNEQFGDIQYIDRNQADESAMSYSKKLEDFLEKVIVSEALREEIRKNFDGHVFLSYRKIDRAYATKLMKLIHKEEALEYIAVWYDEFLVPGEDFNENIEKALREGKLFIMAVTPNAVEDGNYIITTEYPMAKNENKIIVPFEMVKTDRKELEKRYEDIPECVDGNDEKAVFNAIINGFGKIPAEDKSAEREYLLGRAYLNGIDVEVDTERGLKLLESAAAKGSIRAVCQLSFMYSTGNCVEYSLEKSSMWSEREIEILKDKYSETNELSEYLFFADAYISCARCIVQNLHDYKKARGMLFDAIEFIMNYAARTKDKTGLCEKDIAICKQEIGKTYLREGDTKKATEYIDYAGDYFRKRIVESFSEGIYINLVTNMLLQLEIVKAEGNGEDYIENCEAMLRSVEAAVILCPSMEMKQLYEEVYFELAMMTDDEKYGEKRLEICRKWVDICRELAEEFGHIVHKSNLVRALSDVGRRYYQAGKTEEGLKYFNELMIIANSISANQLTDTIFREQAYACVFIFDYYTNKNNGSKALAYAKKGMESAMKVANLKKEDYHGRMALAEALAKMYHDKKIYSEAKKYYIQIIELHKILSEIDEEYRGNFEHLDGYGVIIDRLGEVYEETGAMQDALRCYEEAMEVFKQCPDGIDKFKDIAVCAGKLYSIHVNFSDLMTAFEYSIMAKEYWEKAIEIEKEYKSLMALAYCNIVLLEFYTGSKKELNDPVKAEECKKKLEELTREIKDVEKISLM